MPFPEIARFLQNKDHKPTSMATFAEMINSDKPVLVDFFAAWCGPCRTMEPILKNLKSFIGEAATIIKVDVDKNPAAAMAYQVQGVPTLILFRNGKALWRQSGVVQAKELEQVIRAHSR
jgi:thioredoxin 1